MGRMHVVGHPGLAYECVWVLGAEEGHYLTELFDSLRGEIPAPLLLAHLLQLALLQGVLVLGQLHLQCLEQGL